MTIKQSNTYLHINRGKYADRNSLKIVCCRKSTQHIFRCYNPAHRNFFWKINVQLLLSFKVCVVMKIAQNTIIEMNYYLVPQVPQEMFRVSQMSPIHSVF